MKTIYVVRMGENWNMDYCEAFQTLEGVVDELFERMDEESLYSALDKKELVKTMKAREKKGYLELLVTNDESVEEFTDLTGFCVQSVCLNK